MRSRWGVLLAAFLSGVSMAAEVALVTSATGRIDLREGTAAATELKPFVKLRAGDRLELASSTQLQLVYFAGGRQETWRGPAALHIGAEASSALHGESPPELKTLPRILVRQLTKTPSADGTVRAGMVRMRSMPSGGTVESVERHYADLRRAADPADRTPELYLLASYLELRELDKLDALLRRIGEQSPDDPEIRILAALYARALADARAAAR
jgi:hypothetical protein